MFTLHVDNQRPVAVNQNVDAAIKRLVAETNRPVRVVQFAKYLGDKVEKEHYIRTVYPQVK